ncbi:unnamed protein product [Coregonus sp. 'balchen']|nr:unnamed protein product [Coregonus sp. 'balchen']
MEKMVGVTQKDSSCQTPSEQETSEGSGVKASQSASFSDSTMEHFSRSFKEATVSLVRTTEDLRGDKLSQGGKGSRSAKDRPWAKPAPGGPQGPGGTRSPPYQETDGYCPDLELSDSEPEAKGQRSRQGRVAPGGQAGGDYHKGKQNLGGSSRTSVQRSPDLVLTWCSSHLERNHLSCLSVYCCSSAKSSFLLASTITSHCPVLLPTGLHYNQSLPQSSFYWPPL